MPRKSTNSMCKVCGARASVKKYSSKGANGKTYYYEKFTHLNGVVHYFRAGRRPARTDVSEAFEYLIETKMKEGNYRFGEIKRMFESVFGSATSNTTISRSLMRSIRSNLLEKNTRKGITTYSKKDRSDIVNETKINDASLNYTLSRSKISLTLFVHLTNMSDKLLSQIPVDLPSGSSDTLRDLSLSVYDQSGIIMDGKVKETYSYPGRLGISVDFNRPVRPGGRNFIFLQGSFELREQVVKFGLPLNTESFRINFISDTTKPVHIRRRSLDGIKETNPDSIKRGKLEGGNTYTEVEFVGALKGEVIVVSW